MLKKVPQDGTHDQLLPVHRLFPAESLYSFDLSSATDRLPVSIQVKLLEPVLGKTLALLWRNILVGRSYSYRVVS